MGHFGGSLLAFGFVYFLSDEALGKSGLIGLKIKALKCGGDIAYAMPPLSV